MAWAFVQTAAPDLLDSTGTTGTATLGANLTAGNMVTAACSWDTAGGTAAPALTAGSDTLTQLGPTIGIGNGQAVAWFHKAGITGGGNTVVATWGASQVFRRMVAAEYSGLATSSALVGSVASHDAFAATTATDNLTVGTVTPTVIGQLILSVVCVVDQDELNTAGTGFTKRVDSPQGSGAKIALEDKAASTTSAQSATWTMSIATTTGGEAFAAVFAEPGAGGGSTIVSPVQLLGPSYAATRAASI